MTVAGINIDSIDVIVLMVAISLLAGRAKPRTLINSTFLIAYVIYSVFAANFMTKNVEMMFLLLASFCAITASAHYAIKSHKVITGLLVIMTGYNYAMFIEWGLQDYGFFTDNYQLLFSIAFFILLIDAARDRLGGYHSNDRRRGANHNNKHYFLLRGAA